MFAEILSMIFFVILSKLIVNTYQQNNHNVVHHETRQNIYYCFP